MSKIKAVVFDLDGVYFQGGTETFIKSLNNKYSLAESVIVEVYLKSENMQKFKRGEMTSEDFWTYALQKWDIKATREEIISLLLDSYKINPKVEQYVQTLRSKGIKTAICTNNFPDRLEGLRAKFHLDKYFDVIVTSYEEGMTKPNPKVFEILASKLGLRPEEIVMSDDREVNVEALNKLGFNAFLYVGWEDFVKKVNKFLEV